MANGMLKTCAIRVIDILYLFTHFYSIDFIKYSIIIFTAHRLSTGK